MTQAEELKGKRGVIVTNGDRVRRFSNEQLALMLMCPNDACLDDIKCRRSETDKQILGPASQKNPCISCLYDWLNAEESLEG